MIRVARWNAVVVWVCAGALTTAAAGVRAQEPHAPSGEDRWVNVDGVRIHYLDFGGHGLPLVLVHAESRTAETYRSFGQGIVDEYHVLAVTRPGYGRSEAPQPICDVERQAEYLIGFMDALEIPRAAFAGNSAPSAEMTYLAEHHPHRVAGVIFLSGPPAVGTMELEALDTTGVYRAIRHGFPAESTTCLRQRSEWRPRYLSAGMARIEVPALMFVSSSGFSGNPLNFPLAFVGSSMLDDVFSRMSASDDRARFEQLRRNEELRRAFLDGIGDSTARATLRRLDQDEDLQARVHRFHQDVLLAAAEEQERLAMEAFAVRHVVRLDLPVVSGYEYRDAPELIEPHIRRFLDGLEASADPAAARTGAGRRRVVHVAPPATDYETDRASILVALEAAEPGDTIQFAPGTYLIGEMIRVETPRVTLLGHADGTALRGCEAADREERHAAFTCQVLELTGGHQTVRGLTIEDAGFALVIGCCVAAMQTGESPPSTQPGGYLIVNNTFRRARTGIRVQSGSSEPTVIRGNTFRNLGHAVTINGGTNHVLDNDISALEPAGVPLLGNPIGAIGILPVPPTRECGANIVAGNRIEGHPDAIGIIVGVPGTICRGNVIRNNTIRVRRVRYREPRFTMGSPADSTIVGIPIAVAHIVGRPDLPPFPGFEGEAFVGDNVIEGNRIEGGFGLGIEIRGSDGNRIANNTIRGIERREPFPGNTANSADPAPWQHTNGSGVWVSAGSSQNTIADNEFADIAAAAVMLDGDSTVVQLRSPGDEVRDRGTANRVSRPAGARRQGAATEPSDTSEGLRVLNSLGLARLSGPFETWYSHGHEQRASRIRHMVTGMLDFYRARLDVSVDPYVLVLDSTDWRRLVEAVDACDDCQRINPSYGQQMNWSSPPTIFVPATDSEAAAGVRQGGGRELPPLPADVSRELALAGFEDLGMGDLPGFAQDAVALHEIGHLLTRAFGIATPTTWLNEFLANYWWSAYWREDLPAFTQLAARMTAAAPAAPARDRPSLQDFERGATSGWQNYIWYQSRIGERVDAVLEERGLVFLTDVRSVLPRDRAGTPGTEEVVERLETISTGWREWIASFDSR